MFSIRPLMMSVLVLAFAACAKFEAKILDARNDARKDSVDGRGACSSQFTSDYKAVFIQEKTFGYVFANTLLTVAEKRAKLVEARSACTDFRSRHPDSFNCSLEKNGALTTVSSTDFDSFCQAVADVYSTETTLPSPTPRPQPTPAATPTATPVPTPIPAHPPRPPSEGDERLIQSLTPSQVFVRVADVEAIQRVINSRGTLVIQNGKVVALSAASEQFKADGRGSFCAAVGSDNGSRLWMGRDLAVIKIREDVNQFGHRTVTFYFSKSETLALMCLRLPAVDPFKMGEVRRGFENIVHFSVN